MTPWSFTALALAESSWQPGSMRIRPWRHATAFVAKEEGSSANPTTRPCLLISIAKLSVPPGRPPRFREETTEVALEEAADGWTCAAAVKDMTVSVASTTRAVGLRVPLEKGRLSRQ